jgi:hypothetical protein
VPATTPEDLYDALRACFRAADDAWLEYGVVEDRLRTQAPDLFADLVAAHGHRMFGPSAMSTSTRIAHGLARLEKRGELRSQRWASTGPAWSETITYWSARDGVPHHRRSTWGQLRQSTGRPLGWCSLDEAGLVAPAGRVVPVPAVNADAALQAPVSLPVATPMHPTYLPYTEGQLLEHFVTAIGKGAVNEKHLDYFRKSIAANTAPIDPSLPVELKKKAVSLQRQIEKDERFWVVGALLPVARNADPVGAWTRILRRCFGDVPPVPRFRSWEEALGTDRRLYFEAPLPSPVPYRTHLKATLDTAVITPSLRQAACAPGTQLEGRTWVDAILVCDSGFSVVFEAKVLSDSSPSITYDVKRNQLVRNLDVLLERSTAPGLLGQRDPAASCLVLLTPEVFREDPLSRHYGALYHAYRQDPRQIARHLPHRDAEFDWTGVAQRLGWLTYEDVQAEVPEACGWL